MRTGRKPELLSSGVGKNIWERKDVWKKQGKELYKKKIEEKEVEDKKKERTDIPWRPQTFFNAASFSTLYVFKSQ